MAKTPKTTPTLEPEIEFLATVAADVAVEYPRNLDRLITAAYQTTRAGIEIKDQVSALLRDRHAAIEVFIDEKLANGLSLEEIVTFAAIETPLLPTVTTTHDRISVTWPFRISLDDE